MQTYTKDDVKSVIYGATLLASGGGGGIALALKFLESIPDSATINVASQSDVASSTAGIVAFIGAPDALSSLTDEPVLAAFDKLNSLSPKPIQCLVPVEVGAISSIVPMLVALKRPGIVVADADGAGRAVPTLTDLIFNQAVPTSPVVLSNGAGIDIAFDVDSPATAESLLRPIIAGEFGQAAGLGLWIMTPSLLQSVPIWGTLGVCRFIGQLIVQGTNLDAVVARLGQLGRVVTSTFKGTLHAEGESTSGGFDFGRVTITDPNGDILTLYNQNENMMAWSSGGTSPVGLAPESICFWDLEQNLPFTNAELADHEGKNVAVLFIAALPKLAGSEAAMTGFKAGLQALGYAGTFHIP